MVKRTQQLSSSRLEFKGRSTPRPRIRLRFIRRVLVRICQGLFVVLVIAAGWWWWNRPTPMDPAEIFDGVVYQCQKVQQAGIEGLVHLVTVDLTTHGLELYVTPRDPAAVRAGWEYRTQWAPSVAEEQKLSVLVNGTLYKSAQSPAIFPGSFASSFETLVSNHEASEIHPHSYLLWFEDDLTPHLEKTRPPSPEVCRRARWGISGNLLVDDGKVTSFGNDETDCRTAAGIDPERKLLFLAVFDNATQAAVGRYLVAQRVTDAIILDGGHSTCLVIGEGVGALDPAHWFIRRGQ